MPASLRCWALAVVFCASGVAYRLTDLRPQRPANGVVCDAGEGRIWVAPGAKTHPFSVRGRVIEYTVSEAGSKDIPLDVARKAIAEALSEWSRATGGTLAFRERPPAEIAGVCGSSGLTFSWSGEPANGYSKTWSRYDAATREILSSDIVFNEGMVKSYRHVKYVVWTVGEDREYCPENLTGPCAQYVDLQGVATHAIGHALGLGHSDQIYNTYTDGYDPELVPPESVMRSVPGNSVSNRQLTPDDIAGIVSLYPPPEREPGSVMVEAKLDGAPWSEDISYSVACQQSSQEGYRMPGLFSNMPPGRCCLKYRNGGPTPRIPPAILPSTCQSLTPGRRIGFAVEFRSRKRPPVSGFVLSTEAQSAANGAEMHLTVPRGETAEVCFNASTESSAPDGSIGDWEWKINGHLVELIRGPQPLFCRRLGIGKYAVTLVVTDNWGSRSPVAETNIVVNERRPPSGEPDSNH